MSDWTVEKIQQMIKDDVEEGSGLDWKRSDSLIESRSASREKIKTELSKDVSSFANAAGGRLIYGVGEAPDPPHCPMDFDEGLDSAEVTKMM